MRVRLREGRERTGFRMPQGALGRTGIKRRNADEVHFADAEYVGRPDDLADIEAGFEMIEHEHEREWPLGLVAAEQDVLLVPVSGVLPHIRRNSRPRRPSTSRAKSRSA